MSATVDTDGSRLAVVGQITAENVLGIRQQGEEWLAALRPGTRVHVDLAAATTASSVLLSLLLCLRRRADEQQVALTCINVPDDLTGLSRLNGVSRWLTDC